MATKPTPASRDAGNPFMQHIPLADLHPGAEIGVDARKDRSAADVAAIAASIKEMGLIVPLAVTFKGNKAYVIGGNTRLLALRSIHPKGEWTKVLIPTYRPEKGADSANALELSLIENVLRTDLHPVDRFEVFSTLIKNKVPIEAIARRYMMTVPQVRQALALAGIHPDIRAAWRANEISDQAAEAYSLTQDLEHQLRVFKKLGKQGRGQAWGVKREITGDDGLVKLLKFVGKADYEKAGNHVNQSLFSEQDRDDLQVSSVPALKALAAKKLEAECERLKAAGWGWATTEDRQPKDIHSWRRTPNSNPPKDVKAAAGCVVRISFEGAIDIKYGYIKPGVSVTIPKTPEQQRAATEARKKKVESGGLSQSLCYRLSTQITMAATSALTTDTGLALRVAVASMACADSPAQIYVKGIDEALIDSRLDANFPAYFEDLAKRTPESLVVALAVWVAASLDMVAHHPHSMPLAEDPDTGNAELLNAMRPEALNAALRKHFDRKDYFASVNADLVKAAMTDCGQSYPANAKKSALVEMAVKSVDPMWLPPEMRTKHYDGPAAPKAKAPAKKATTKKPAKKKARR